MPDSWTCPGCSHEPFVRHFNYIDHIRRSQLCRAAAAAAAAADADGAAAAEAAAFSPTAASPDPIRGDRSKSSVADDSPDDEDEVLCGVADDDVADEFVRQMMTRACLFCLTNNVLVHVLIHVGSF